MLTCYGEDCNIEYNSESWIETHVPDEVWNKISPKKNGGGILCISCIVKRLREVGYEQDEIPIEICGTEPIYCK